MENKEIRELAQRKKVRHWQIADYIGISDGTLVKWLRHELPEERAQKIMEAIDAIASTKEA